MLENIWYNNYTSGYSPKTRGVWTWGEIISYIHKKWPWDLLIKNNWKKVQKLMIVHRKLCHNIYLLINLSFAAVHVFI